jgi:hypothetical protein
MDDRDVRVDRMRSCDHYEVDELSLTGWSNLDAHSNLGGLRSSVGHQHWDVLLNLVGHRGCK